MARTEVANHPGSVLVIEGTARWPWAFGEDPAVTLIFGPGFNTGYAPVGSQHGVLLMPASYAESGFSTGPHHPRGHHRLCRLHRPA